MGKNPFLRFLRFFQERTLKKREKQGIWCFLPFKAFLDNILCKVYYL